MTSIREEVLENAKELVLKDRNTDYDEPEKNFETILGFWKAYISAKGGFSALYSQDIAVLMILVKVSRIATSPHKVDHWIDIAGYAACGAECIAEKQHE